MFVTQVNSSKLFLLEGNRLWKAALFGYKDRLKQSLRYVYI